MLQGRATYTDFHLCYNYEVIMRSPVAECLIFGAVVYKSNSYIAQFCYVQCIVDYPVCRLSVHDPMSVMTIDLLTTIRIKVI